MAKTRTAWVWSRSSTSMPCCGSAWTPTASRFSPSTLASRPSAQRISARRDLAGLAGPAVLVVDDFLAVPRLDLRDGHAAMEGDALHR